MLTKALRRLALAVAMLVGAAIPLMPTRSAAANVVGLDVIACPQGISILVNENNPNAPAPQVDFGILPAGPGAAAKLIGVTTDGLPDGVARQYVYWNDIGLTAGASGQVIARGARNEGYATFVVDADCPPLGSVRGSAFEDRNSNGIRDAGEPGIGTASWKVTAGGDWFICGVVGGDSTFGPTVKPGTYTVIPIAQPGWRATTPPHIALVKRLGYAALGNDIGFVRAPSAGDNCGQYAPPLAAFAAPAPVAQPVVQDADAWLSSNGAFSALLQAADLAGVRALFSAPGPYTILAPTDAAFDQLSPSGRDRLLNNPRLLAEVLKCHIIPGVVDLAGIGTRGRTFRTLGARSVTLRVRNGALYANDAIIGEVVPVSNGVILVPDRVLFVR